MNEFYKEKAFTWSDEEDSTPHEGDNNRNKKTKPMGKPLISDNVAAN